MSCTPEITSKVSPIGSSINKNLLTPCRRVGLSRKRKTPSSIGKICLENSPISTNDRSFTETTPINHRKCIKRKSNVKIDIIPTIPSILSKSDHKLLQKSRDIDTKNRAVNNFVKKQLSKTDSFQSCSDDLFDCNDSSFLNMEDAESLTNNMIHDTEISRNKLCLGQPVCGTDYTDTELNLRKPITHSFTSKSLVISELNSSTKLSKLDIRETHKTSKHSDSDEDFIVNKNDLKQKQNKVIKQKSIRKTLSLKKSISSIDDEFAAANSNQSSNGFKECHVQLQNITVNKTHTPEKSQSETYKSCDKTIDIMIDEEEDAFTSTPEEENMKKINILQKVRALEKTVKQKKQKLADLKQASIYKNKHNIEDLKQLTSKWIAGCVAGLNDLLTQLQTHGPMNMTTLLNNLQIPSDIVAKLSLNVD